MTALHPKLERLLGYVVANADHGCLTTEERERSEAMAIEAQREVGADAILKVAAMIRGWAESGMHSNSSGGTALRDVSEALKVEAEMIREGEPEPCDPFCDICGRALSVTDSCGFAVCSEECCHEAERRSEVTP